MRTVVASLFAIVGLASFVSADDFTLKNADGESFGPFPVKEGAAIRLNDATYRIASITNTAEQRLMRKLQTIVIPEMDFKATPMEDVVDFLRKAAKKNDPTGEGVNIIFTPSSLGFATNVPQGDASNVTAKVTFAARGISLFEAISIVANVAGYRYVLRPQVIFVLPLGAPVGPLRRRSYDVLPPFMQALSATTTSVGPGAATHPDSRESLKETFANFGIPWPTGSSIQHLPQVGKLIVVNTEENLVQLDRILSVLNIIPSQIRLEFFFVAFPTGMVVRTESGKHFTSDDALKLWKEGKGRAVSTFLIITKSASEATTKDVTEFIYPTEYSFEPSGQGSNPPPSVVGGAVTPSGFQTREVGVIVSVMPEITPDGQMIDLSFTPQFVEEPAWEEYKAVLVVVGSSPTNVTCRLPTFSAHSLSTQLSVRRGSTVVVGGGWNLRRTPEVMYLILKTDLVDIDGKVLPPPDLSEIIHD